jgi:lysophospholipid acyltransferase (LPLAT)-like uncharacterized protein
MIREKIKHLVYRYLLPYAGMLLVKSISLTYRVRIVDPENESRILNKEGSLIYASWHQRFFPGATYFGNRKLVAIIISRSRDGEFIAHIAGLFGLHPVRGSSSRGGTEALRKIRRLSLRGYKIGHIVDGPNGPSGVVKPGLIAMAQITGKPIVPTIYSCQRRWVFNSWDRFMVPKPFSRVILKFGEAVYVSRRLDENSFENLRLLVEQRLKELYDEADMIWVRPEKVREIFNG